MSTRTYLLVGIVIGGFIYLIGVLFGSDIANWAVQRQIESAAKSQVIFEAVVFQPLEFIFTQDTRIMGAVLVAVAWPAFFLLLFLLVIALVALEFIDANDAITNPISSLPVGVRMLLHI
jgi:hypothetical protein